MADTEPLSIADVTVHWIITGRVQGVWFRDFTRRAARELDLEGWVKNLPDGSVEAMVTGPRSRVVDLRQQVEEGPPAARVDNITEEFMDPTKADIGTGAFEVRY